MEDSILLRLDWAEIIEASSKSPLGVTSLALIVLSILVWKLFGNDRKGKIKLAALLILIGGITIMSYVIIKAASVETEMLKEKERVSNLLTYCRSSEVKKVVTGTCEAKDRSGFESSPSARCSITLTAPEDFFFADSQVTVTAEHYRNISGAAAKDAIKPIKTIEFESNSLPIQFGGTIGCTNARGTGRTCVVSATVQAQAFPKQCLEVYRDLRS